MSVLSKIGNLFHGAVSEIDKLNQELVDLVGPKASAYEIAIAAAVKKAYPMVTAELYTAIKQAGNEAVQAVVKTLPDALALVVGSEDWNTALGHFAANLGALGLNPASLEAMGKTALLNASHICLMTFGAALEGAVSSNPTSKPASSPAEPSSAESKPTGAHAATSK